VSSILFLIAYVLLLLLAAHHFIHARRGLRTGVVEGLVFGYWVKRYNRDSDAADFWLNVWSALFVSGLGAVRRSVRAIRASSAS
jgi:hypothetical protein